MAKGRKIDFEKSLAELEELVEAMEEGEMTLEESLKAFEKGMQLSRDCQQALSTAEQKVQLLVEEKGELRFEEFSDDSDT